MMGTRIDGGQEGGTKGWGTGGWDQGMGTRRVRPRDGD